MNKLFNSFYMLIYLKYIIIIFLKLPFRNLSQLKCVQGEFQHYFYKKKNSARIEDET